MVIISKTYSTITPESCEDGETAENGFDSEYEEVSFRELVDLMREHPHASCSHPSSVQVWFSSGYQTEDFATGEEKETSIHFHRDNLPANEKYWLKAARVAGVISE